MIIENPNYKMNISVVISLCVVFLLCCEKTAALNDWAAFAFKPELNPVQAHINMSETEVSHQDLFKYVRQYSTRGIVFVILLHNVSFTYYKYCAVISHRIWTSPYKYTTTSLYSASCFRHTLNKTYGMPVRNPHKALELLKEKASTYHYLSTDTYDALSWTTQLRCLPNCLYILRFAPIKGDFENKYAILDRRLYYTMKNTNRYCHYNALLIMNSLSSDLKNVRITKNKYLERRECGWAILTSKFAICAGRMVLVYETLVCRRYIVSNETFYITGMYSKWNEKKSSGTANLTTSIYNVTIEIEEHEDKMFHLTTMQVGQHLFRLDLEATEYQSKYCPYNLKFFAKPMDNGTAVHLILTSFYFIGRWDNATVYAKPVDFVTSKPCSKTSSPSRKSICLFGCLTGCNKNLLG